MNFRIKILLFVIPLSFFLCFMSNTYSRYVADATGNLKMSFAQWQILVNNEDITKNTSSSIVLTPVIDANDYVKSNKIAPSSTGYFDISIDPSNVDVSFNYNISLNEFFGGLGIIFIFFSYLQYRFCIYFFRLLY